MILLHIEISHRGIDFFKALFKILNNSCLALNINKFFPHREEKCSVNTCSVYRVIRRDINEDSGRYVSLFNIALTTYSYSSTILHKIDDSLEMFIINDSVKIGAIFRIHSVKIFDHFAATLKKLLLHFFAAQ